MRKIFISIILTLLAAAGLQAQNPVDSARIYFRAGYRYFEPDLGDNAAEMAKFVDMVRRAAADDDIHRIVVRAYASPDGTNEANERLTGYRCDEIANYVISRTGIAPGLLKALPGGVAWDELLRLVEQTPDVPYREQVIDVLKNTPVWVFDSAGSVAGSRKQSLMEVGGGRAYRWMYDNLFPQLRSAVAVSLFLKSDVRAAIEAAAEAARAAANAARAAAAAASAAAEASDVATEVAKEYAEAVRAAEEAAGRAARAAADAADASRLAQRAADEADAAAKAAETAQEVAEAQAKAAEAQQARTVAEQARDAAIAAQSEAEAARAAAEAIARNAGYGIDDQKSTEPDTIAVTAAQEEPFHRFALKSNLIYDALLTPNVELEWLINPTWSVSVEANVAWWKNDPRHKYYQLMMISPEVRYHINPRAPWHGLYVGAFAGGGKYDLENKKTGYKGEGGLAGASVGYMWHVSRCISLEAELGIGYLYTRYKEYVPYDGHYLYQRTKTLNYFGPLKLKFSFVWRFSDSNKIRR